mmetsp:Transcript_47508/g.101609  ORF Transcript_47508/g.101609 Transcript_47508/m.101609 type:complete len:319 (-) Transcript_47508:22-978(-)
MYRPLDCTAFSLHPLGASLAAVCTSCLALDPILAVRDSLRFRRVSRRARRPMADGSSYSAACRPTGGVQGAAADFRTGSLRTPAGTASLAAPQPEKRPGAVEFMLWASSARSALKGGRKPGSLCSPVRDPPPTNHEFSSAAVAGSGGDSRLSATCRGSNTWSPTSSNRCTPPPLSPVKSLSWAWPGSPVGSGSSAASSCHSGNSPNPEASWGLAMEASRSSSSAVVCSGIAPNGSSSVFIVALASGAPSLRGWLTKESDCLDMSTWVASRGAPPASHSTKDPSQDSDTAVSRQKVSPTSRAEWATPRLPPTQWVDGAG